MGIKKRLAAFAVSAAMFITLLPASAFAEESEHKLCKGSFNYAVGETSGTYYYSDGYFANPSTQRDEHLTTMSLCLSIASTDKNTDGSVYDILKNTGFDEASFAEEDMEKHTADTIGTLIASKTTDSGDKLVAVVVNGLNYGEEWQSNLTVGSKGDAEGFTKAARKVLMRILRYEIDNDLTGAKLWIVGYSRGGAVADLTGKMINKDLGLFDITEADLYDYTFATPRGSAKACGYKNIQNVIDPNDVIPRLMPKGWGIERAGTEFAVPREKQTVQPKVLSLSNGLSVADKTETVKDPETGTSTTVPVDPVDMEQFLDSFSTFLTDHITRETFDSQRDSIPPFVAKLITDNREYKITNFLADSFKGIGLTSPLFVPLLTILTYPEESADYQKVMQELPKTISDFIDSSEYKDKLTQEDIELTKKALPALVKVFAPAVRADFPSMFEKTSTLIGNIGSIIANHYPASYYKLLTAIDSYYTDEKSVAAGTLSMFGKSYKEEEYTDNAQLGIPDTDIEVLKNGYDVEYKMIYDVLEEKDVANADVKAVASAVGASPDLAIYCNNTIARTQTFGKQETAELQGSFDVTFRCIPGQDEKLDKDGKYYFIQYQNGTAKLINAQFSFNDKGELTIAYTNDKRGNYALVYISSDTAEHLRIYGKNRYETSRKIADKFAFYDASDKFDSVIVASGDNFADALSASTLAKAKHAPVLLTTNNDPETTANYIKQNTDAGKTVYIIGGDGAISYRLDKLLSTESDKQYDVKRLAGLNRYDTNLAVLKEAGVTSGEILIASGLDYADAISASATGKALMLAGKDGLTAEQSEFLKAITDGSAAIIGGTSAVSEKTQTQLGEIFENVERLGGKNRYETSKLVAEKYFKSAKAAVLASGENFPDGLSGAPLAMLCQAPLLLVSNAAYEPAQQFAQQQNIKKTIILGGPTLISDETAEKITTSAAAAFH